MWEYRPPYLPSPLVIHVGENAPVTEPSWFYLGFSRRPDSPEQRQPQPLDHPIGYHEVTHLRITGPLGEDQSAAARAVACFGLVALAAGHEHLLEMTFDGGTQQRRMDFRPVLPLVFRW